MQSKQEFYQKKLFDYLTKRWGSTAVLSRTMDVLGLQKGAVYKRMNGSTALTMDQLLELSQHFRVSLDHIFQEGDFIVCQHPFMNQTSTIDFMGRFSHFLKPMSTLSNSNLVYLANELPVFYYLSHKHLFNFLLAIWNHLHLSEAKMIIEENSNMDFQIELLRKEITHYYDKYPVTEIWNNNMFANLYQQIIFCITIRAFKDHAYIKNLILDIRNLIHNLKSIVMREGDFASSKRQIYINDYGNYLNLVLFESTEIKSTFIGYDIPHFIVSYDNKFYQFSKEWVGKIRRRSALITQEGLQPKEWFFLKLESDFKQFEERVEKLYQVYYT